MKKLEIETFFTIYVGLSVLKVVYWLGLVLSNSNFFINEKSQGRKSVRKKSTYLHTPANSASIALISHVTLQLKNVGKYSWVNI